MASTSDQELSLEQIRELENRLQAKNERKRFLLPPKKSKEPPRKQESWGEMVPASEPISLEDVRVIANKLKQRRIVWGLTQGQLGELICYKYGARLSQTTVSRFEMMDCTVATARRLYKPMKEMLELIDQLYKKNGPQQTESLCNLVKETIGEVVPALRERKRRVTYTDEQLNALDSLFQQCDSPSSSQLNRFALALGLSFSEVRVWFCNRRQKRRKTMSPRTDNIGESEEDILARLENNRRKEATVRAQLQRQDANGADVTPLIESLDKMPKQEIVINVSQKV